MNRLTLIRVALVFAAPTLRADDRKDILGVWIGAMQGEPPGSIELTITPDKISGRNPRTGKSLGEGAYEIDPVKKTITTRGIASPVKGNLYLGLYSLEGNTLRWVSSSHGRKRPVDLVHRPDRDQFLMTLERKS
jgi:hypothetical protein